MRSSTEICKSQKEPNKLWSWIIQKKWSEEKKKKNQQTVSTVDWIKQNLWSRDRSFKRPHSSAGRESACKAGDPGSIPGLGGSPGEGNGNPLQYSCLQNPMDKGVSQATVHGVTRVRHDLA